MASRSFISCIQTSSKLMRNRAILSNLNKLNYLSTNSTTTSLSPKNKLNQVDVVKQQRALIHLSSMRMSDVVTVETPTFADSIKEGDISFLKKPGDAVKQDEVIAKIETDKTTMEISSPTSGVIEALLVPEGAVTANLPIIKIKVGAAGATPAAPAAPKPAEAAAKPAAQAPPPPPPQPKPAPTGLPEIPQVPKSPAATTPLSQIPITPLAQQAISAAAPADINKIGGTRSETRVKMSKMRQTVANRLKASQNTCAMLTTFNEINMGNLVELRKAYGEQFLKKHNLKLGFMSAFVKAAASALQDQPVVNAFIEDKEIVYRDYVDISVAVATPKGLVVPVLRNVEKMNYANIEKEIAALGERARLNKLAIEDMQGGTFTISNGGVFGSLFGTPIINLPQSAILGMHGVFDRPVAINGQVVVRPMMYVALTYDHRLIDGREAVTFLRKIKSAVEDPRTLLLDI
jgi:2-oxoglutarate dehydrogenase E2 component (dihydrolipoamide succinyltransferase)